MTIGRPSSYNPEYCDQIIKFFSREPFTVLLVDDGGGNKVPALDRKGQPILIPCTFPTKEGFARSIGVCRDTIHEWSRVYSDFSDAIKKAETIQKDILIQNGLLGAYEKTFAIFVAKNVTDMSDKQDINHTSSDGSMSPKDSTSATIEALKRKHADT